MEATKRVVIENFAKDSWEQDASDDLVDKCVKIVDKTIVKDIDSFGLKCSSKAAELAYCIWREMFLTCPEDRQEITKRCMKLRNVMSKIDDNQVKN